MTPLRRRADTYAMGRYSKETIARAAIGQTYRIRRGRRYDLLGVLVAKERGPRGYNVRFELAGEVTYNGFAGAATVVQRRCV